jgi:uncharacterized protein YkwD
MTRIVPIALVMFLSVAFAMAAFAVEPSNEITAANVLRLMNDYRAGAGLAPLRSDERQQEGSRCQARNERRHRTKRTFRFPPRQGRQKTARGIRY